MITLFLCSLAWKLYDNAVKSGRWRAYLAHRRRCGECKRW